ncbi:nitroreductase family protein [Ruminococcus flavefaciens]|uniref:nitroreductase family protein n=1 Tax=Ruminococcus flavefaciens TaxID=1265 RepID=UPI0002E74470|nr:nitroreductase family protein [Ruminococcus flavefaciens]
MGFMELASGRYSVRSFDDRPITSEHLGIILKAANAAPTGCNYQPQRIYVVQSDEMLSKLREISKCTFGARTILVFTYNKDEDWKNPLESGVRSGIEDVSIVATHVMLQAWELGIGSCWVNYFSNSRLERELGIPENENSVLIMPVGYPSKDSGPLHLHEECKPLDATVRFI